MRPVKLEWVRLGTRYAHISEFAHLRVGHRPRVHCPACEAEVTMRFGADIRDHVAHRPGSTCAVTAPETARHLNAKLHIAHELKKVQTITIEQFCASGCGDSLSIPEWTDLWDDAKPEVRVDTLRPDVVLFATEKAVAAIEVAETHPVPQEKVEALAALGLPWVEVKSSDIIGPNGPTWFAPAPLPVLRHNSVLGRICASCRAKDDTASRAVAATKLQAERSYSGATWEPPRAWSPHIIAYRAVDYYFPSGRRFRDIYYIVQLWERAVLRRDGCKFPLYTQYGFPPRHEKNEFLAAFKEECRQIKLRRRASLLDCRMPWMSTPVLTFDDMYIDDHEVGPDFLYDEKRFPPRYRWSRHDGDWCLIDGMESVYWPVIAN
jgi:hypothetical protein